MSAVKSDRDLIVWQCALDLAVECEAVSRLLPRSRRASLATQLRRSAGSVPANIAEGNGRLTRADYLRHLSIANGSLMELETHLRMIERMRLVPAADVLRATELANRVGRLLNFLIRALRAPRGDSK